MMRPRSAFCFLAFISLATSSAILPLTIDALSSAQNAQHVISSRSPLPLVLWHGLGDSFDAAGLQEVAALANETNPGTNVHIIRLGDTGSSDRSASFFGNVTEQVESVCEQIANHPQLRASPAINAIGFSQGGQFLRGYVERCNKPPVYNLVTFGSQHNGISEFEACSGPTDWTCQSANALLRSGRWSNLAQRKLVPAQYFRDPEELDLYLENSNYLADINNERKSKNTTYASNIAKLNKFAMYLFEEDTTVVPVESGWFAEVNRTSEKVTPLRERAIYKEDWLGLKKLDARGGLIFEKTRGRHMELTDEVLKDVYKKYFHPLEQWELDVWKQRSEATLSNM